MKTIAAHELRLLFVSPTAWGLLAVVQLILAYLFLQHLDAYARLQPKLAAIEGAPGVTDLVIAPMLANAGFVFLLVSPLLCMRLFSDERRTGTLTLLLCAPLSATQIVLGKYLGVLIFFGVLVFTVSLMPLSLAIGAELDYGKLGGGALGLTLLAASFSAVGLYVSTLTNQPGAAAIGTFGILVFFWIIDWAGPENSDSDSLFAWLSLLRHFEELLKGSVGSGDLAFFATIIGAFLTMTVRRLELQRIEP